MIRSSSAAATSFLVIGLVACSAARADSKQWQFDVKTSYLVIGDHAKRATGGLMPSILGRRVWPVEKVSVGIGGHLGTFGLWGDAYWMGILGGPVVSVGIRPLGSRLFLDLAAQLDFGRIPVCNAWGLCLRYIGFFPLTQVSAAYSPTNHLGLVAGIGLRWIQTLGWSGVSAEPSLSGRFFW